MKKTLTLTLFLLLLVSARTLAQTISVDSMITVATADGKNLRLTPQQKERLKDDRKNSRSDLFKPNTDNASDASLLKDSVYVRAFRAAAFKKYKHTTWHYVLWIGGAAYIVACIIDNIINNPPSSVPAPGSI